MSLPRRTAAVHQYLCLIAHRTHDFRQRPQRRRHAVELSTAVIGNHNGCCSFVHRASGIICGENAFDHNRPGPRLPDPSEIVPGYGRESPKPPRHR